MRSCTSFEDLVTSVIASPSPCAMAYVAPSRKSPYSVLYWNVGIEIERKNRSSSGAPLTSYETSRIISHRINVHARRMADDVLVDA